MTTMLVDVSNIVVAMRFASIKTPSSRRQKEKMITEVLARDAISWILGSATKNSCTSIVIAKDAKNVWRRDIDSLYKAGRTTHEDVYYEEMIQAIDLVCEFFKEQTSAYVIQAPRCEADDIIAIWCRMSVGDILILSTDTDFTQLVSPRVRLYSPVQKVFREPEDPQYELFVKCIRGDRSDNIRSAYPRVRETVLKKAWESDYDLLNLLEHTLPDGVKVGDNFERNQSLIDLSMQPEHIVKSVEAEIMNYSPSKYSEMSASKWFMDNGLGDATSVLRFRDHSLKTPPSLYK